MTLDSNIRISNAKYCPDDIKYVNIVDTHGQEIQLIDSSKVAATLELEHAVVYTENGEYEILPDDGADGIAKVNIQVAVPEKVIEPATDIDVDVQTYSGVITVAPVAGEGIEGCNITLSNIPDTSANKLYCWKNTIAGYPAPYIWTVFATAPEDYEEQDPETGDIITVPGILPTDNYVSAINDVALRLTKAPFANIFGIVDEFEYTCDTENNQIKFRGADKDGYNVRCSFERYEALDIDLAYLMPERV